MIGSYSKMRHIVAIFVEQGSKCMQVSSQLYSRALWNPVKYGHGLKYSEEYYFCAQHLNFSLKGADTSRPHMVAREKLTPEVACIRILQLQLNCVVPWALHLAKIKQNRIVGLTLPVL